MRARHLIPLAAVAASSVLVLPSPAAADPVTGPVTGTDRTDDPLFIDDEEGVHIPLEESAQALWDGDAFVFRAFEEDDGETYRMASADLAATPACPDLPVTVTATVEVELGDNRVFGYAGTMMLIQDGPVALDSPHEGTILDEVQPERNAEPGHVETLTVSAEVPGAVLAEGRLGVVLALETWDDAPKAWQARGFTASYAYAEGDCTPPPPAPRCPEDGLQVLQGGALATGITPNPASRLVHVDVERLARKALNPITEPLLDLDTAELVHDLNCQVVEPVEDVVDDLTIPLVKQVKKALKGVKLFR